MDASILTFQKALMALKVALKEPKSDIARDASIQRFEFCVELAWKASKKKLGLQTSSPKMIVREMLASALIDDEKVWFEFLDARNLSSHTYQEAIAKHVYEVAKRFVDPAQDLLKRLEKK